MQFTYIGIVNVLLRRAAFHFSCGLFLVTLGCADQKESHTFDTQVLANETEKTNSNDAAAPSRIDASAPSRAISWAELSHMLDGIPSKRVPTKQDWDKGDDHLRRKLQDLLDEAEGRKLGASASVSDIENLAKQLTEGMVMEQQVRLALERLGPSDESDDAQSSGQDGERISWPKFAAMLEGSGLANLVTKQEWEKGDQHLKDKLDSLVTACEEHEQAVMQMNAYNEATRGVPDYRLLNAAVAQTEQVRTLRKLLDGDIPP